MKKALAFLLFSIGVAILFFVGTRIYLVHKAISVYNEYEEKSSHFYFEPK